MTRLLSCSTLALAFLASCDVAVAQSPMKPGLAHYRRAGQRLEQRMELVRRQNVTDSETTPAAGGPAATTGNVAAATTSSAAADPLSSFVGGLLPTQATTTPAQTTTTTTTPPATTTTTTSSRTRSSSSSSALVVVTSTATIDPTSSTSLASVSASASATAAADTSKKSSSGIGHTTLIIIIVIASCVAGIAAIWTIIRKTAFSPSRRFEAKLAPINFKPGGEKDDDPYLAPHTRSPSNLSELSNGRPQQPAYAPGYAGSLSRSDSGGKGSVRSFQADGIPYVAGYGAPQHYGGGRGSPVPTYQTHAPGYPAEQAGYGYADLQRGPSHSMRPPALQRGPSSARSQLAYDYDSAQQAARQARY